jgi:hypothetical protein
MSGIMVAVAGNAQNFVYVPGLWVSELASADLSPIDGSASSTGNNTVTVTRNWIGYFTPASTGSVNLSIQVSASVEFNSFNSGASTTGRLWLGSTAIAGNNAQADISITRTSGTGTSTVAFNLTAGVYYPIRIRWNGSYTGGFVDDFFSFREGIATGSIAFLVNNSTNVTNRIFYNSIPPQGF